VQALPSLHDRPATAECAQPVAALHESSVHGFPSSQLAAGPAAHCPEALHASPLVQALPSLQERPGAAAWAHPLAAEQESSVHEFPSSQLIAGPETHAPEMLQVSAPVHTLPSLQARPGTP